MTAPGKQMNVLWIMTDQHWADCLGCMVHPVVQTPHLDAVAREGVVFENAFCQSSVCMASRGSLFTGRYPEAIRIRGMGVLPPWEITFPEMLKREGYRTAAFGKVHLTPEQYTRDHLESEVPVLDWRRFADRARIPDFPHDPCKVDYGFDIHVGCDDANQGHFRRWLETRDPTLARLPSRPPTNGEPRDLYISPYPSHSHQTTFIAESCLDYLASRDEDAPWFAFCSFIAPHHPFEAPQDQIDRYDVDAVPLPEPKGGVDPATIPFPMAEAVGEMDRFPEEVQRRIVLHYLASISLIDDAVGRLVGELERTGQLENTLVLFVADHGEFLGNHGLLRKPSLHY
ncbi:MAG: sulfatase-like hydrolase/transferase, partial [Candidatus Latescibacteria bacterium]|nr:sulfatase-like hydrolase/transferase [Candidatus Latescibacterota bacterium]